MPARIDPRNRTVPRLMRGVAVLTLGLGALSACSSNGSDASATTSTTSAAGSTASSSSAGASSSGATQAQSITATEADFSISLDKDTLTAGSYEITVKNDGNATHDLAVEEDGTTKATSSRIGPGESTTLSVDLDAGEYTFYCSIGNHRAMGMEKTVTVK